MSKEMVTEATVSADGLKTMIKVAEATLNLEVEEFNSTDLPFTISRENMLLMELSDALWSLSVSVLKREKVYLGDIEDHYDEIDLDYENQCAFTLKINDFPETLESGAKITLVYGVGRFPKQTKQFDYSSTINFEGSVITECTEALRRFNRGNWLQTAQDSEPVTLQCLLTIYVEKTKNLSLVNSKALASKALAERMSRLIDDDSSSDFLFIVKGSQFRAHKNILAAASAVWQKMFTADYKEKESGTCKVDHIEPEVFKALLSYVYCAEIPENFNDLAFGLLEAAHYYEIESLKKICVGHLTQTLSVDNAVQVFGATHHYSLDLTRSAWNVIKREYLKVSLPSEYLPTPQEVEELLALKEKEKTIYEKLANKAK